MQNPCSANRPPGEFAALGERVQALNGFDRDMNELVDDVKLIKEGDGDANYAYYALHELHPSSPAHGDDGPGTGRHLCHDLDAGGEGEARASPEAEIGCRKG